MPGTPVIYYGDEIGMGDNYYLGDRDGVRTPMQWSPDRNGGFSRADPRSSTCRRSWTRSTATRRSTSRRRRATPHSLLNWMRRMIAVRKQHAAFGRGTLRSSTREPQGPGLSARARRRGILCVANVSRTPQAVELDLSEFAAACRSS